MYVVFCMTNYGSGYYTAGIYRSKEKAEARMEWCEAHTPDPENDSWNVIYIRGGENKTAPILDGYYHEFDLKNLDQYMEEGE